MSTQQPLTGRNEAFSIESHGIDHIPEAERNATPTGIFFTWFGANVIFTYIVLGAIIGSLGLALWQALAAVLVGSLLYWLVGLTSIAGPRAGTATLTASRSAFGIVGNRVPAALSWLTAVGWTAVNMIIGVLSLVTFVQLAGASSSTALKLVILVLMTAATVIIALLGHATILALNKVLSFLLGAGTLVLGVYVLTELGSTDLSGSAESGQFGTWLIAFILIAAAPLSYVNTGSDYSRYLPSRTPSRTIIWSTMMGGFVPAAVISTIGVLAAAITDMADPIAGLEAVVPKAFLMVYLLVVVGGTVTNNFLNTYSSGMSLLAVGISTTRTKAIGVNMLLAVIATAYVVFWRDLSESLTEFLSLMVIWSSAWCGVFLADFVVRRGSYDPVALHAANGGPYWFARGWNLVAMGWFLAGVVAAGLFANSNLWTGPLVGLIDDGDLSIPVGLAVSFVGYCAHSRLMANRTESVRPVPAR